MALIASDPSFRCVFFASLAARDVIEKKYFISYLAKKRQAAVTLLRGRVTDGRRPEKARFLHRPGTTGNHRLLVRFSTATPPTLQVLTQTMARRHEKHKTKGVDEKTPHKEISGKRTSARFMLLLSRAIYRFPRDKRPQGCT